MSDYERAWADIQDTVYDLQLDPAAFEAALPHTGKRPPAYRPDPVSRPPVGTGVEAAIRPDIVLDGAVHGSTVSRLASVRGDSHRYHGECRQDTALMARAGDGRDSLLILVIADGVGSAPLSHLGSKGACQLLVEQLDRASADVLAALRGHDSARLQNCVEQAVSKVAEMLSKAATAKGNPPAAYSTTLRALLVPADPAIRARGFLAVGDGGLLLLRDGRFHDLLALLDGTAPTRSAGVIDTRTEALPVSFTRPVSRIIPGSRAGDVLVLCTDGLSVPLEKEPQLQAFLAEQWGAGTVPGLAQFLWQAQVRARSYDDDRSVACLWEGRA